MIKIDVDTSLAIAKLDASTEKLHSAASNAVAECSNRLFSIVQGKLSGEVLNVRSGALRRSIRVDSVEIAKRISARVFSDGSVPYARIQEYGGRVNIPANAPRQAKALAFAWNGRMVFVKTTAAHVINMPERSYMRTSLAEVELAFAASIRQSVADALA
jgi:hypothetical protein